MTELWVCCRSSHKFKAHMLKNWEGNNWSLSRELGAQNLQGDTERAGLVYPGEREAIG